MIIVDENIDYSLVSILRNANYDVLPIGETYEGISDRKIVDIAKTYNGLVITEDKDFGELIFSYHIRGCSVILLRYGKSDFKEVEHNLFNALDYYKNHIGQYFFTITAKKVRVRKI